MAQGKQYDNTNRGMLSRNDRKESDKHPDFTGSINVDGVEYWLNGWLKESGPQSKTPGRKFFSLSVKPKDQPKGRTASRPEPSRHEPEPYDIPDDDVPF